MNDKTYWYPNRWRDDGANIEALEPWQLLVAACHFAPQMGDCIEFDYGYRFENGVIYQGGEGGREFNLNGDIDMDAPMLALHSYLKFSWKDYARRCLQDCINKTE